MSAMPAQTCQWQVHGLNLAGLSWGEPGATPVLCLHGWLDNAASFGELAPQLTDCHVVAPDLTGHGQSDRRSADATYQIWDDLPEVLGIVEELGWDRFTLVGHSRGAIIASLFAAAYPERVERLVLLDSVSPQPVPESEFPAQLRRFLKDKGKLLGRNNRLFDSVDDATRGRQIEGLSSVAAAKLAARNLRSCEGGYTWTTDPRLRGASAVKLTQGQIDAVLAALSMPVLLLLGRDGFGGQHPELAESAGKSIPSLQLGWVEGGHHFHMEAGAREAARQIEEFLKS